MGKIRVIRWSKFHWCRILRGSFVCFVINDVVGDVGKVVSLSDGVILIFVGENRYWAWRDAAGSDSSSVSCQKRTILRAIVRSFHCAWKSERLEQETK